MTIEITTKEQLALIGVDEAYPLSGDYLLMNDIDLEGDDDNQWTPIAPITVDELGNPTLLNRFTGNLEGNGKTISGLYVNNLDDNAFGYSLFGVVYGTVRHLCVQGSITTRNSESGGTVVSGIAGVVAGGGVIEECQSDVNVTGYSYVSGIAAFIYSGGTILNCKATGTITGTVFVSGICCGVADFEATKDVAYIAKNVFTGTLNVTGGDPANYGVGMICFEPVLADPQIYFASDRCYWDYTKSAYTNSYVGEQKTTAELMQQDTFVHWNFNTVWGIDEGTSYPYLLCLEKVTMPDVVGESLASAYTTLEALGLTVAVIVSYDSECSAGLICTQSEASGSSVSYGTKITLAISLGDESTDNDTSNVIPMTDMLRSGVAWLGQQRVANCSSEVSYSRPPDSYTVNATYGKTSVEIADESGMTIIAKVWDFIVQESELDFEPEAGDIIEADGRQYEVMNLGGNCWQWSDPFRTAYRIHTKDIGTA